MGYSSRSMEKPPLMKSRGSLSMADEGKDGFESREIKYHGKSPDKLLDELKKKNQDRHSQYNRKRRTALILIALSGLVVAGLALISVIYRGQSSETPDYIQTINPFVFKIVSESEYEYGHENNIKVRVSNIERREAGFTFKDFTFSITSERGERVFTFNYPV